MKSPVHFQPIERELEPVRGYLKGRVLNAGCGNRDISQFLKAGGARETVNCDLIETSIPGAIRCDLSNLPFEPESFDSVLCNAVLEHVADPAAVMGELHRVLKPGGNLVLCVPFLQPFHPVPRDYRRYTGEGLRELASAGGFEVVREEAVHSAAQTVGWIVWATLEEAGPAFRIPGQLLLWLPICIWTRLSVQTRRPAPVYQANAIRLVLRKP